MKAIARVWTCVSTVIVTAAVIFALLVSGARLAGFKVFTVLSGSMEPTYQVGSLIYVKPVDVFRLRSGDVISFRIDDKTVATHRIVEVVPDEIDPNVLRFSTKGDANSAKDGSLVHHKDIIGTPVFSIPKLGYWAGCIQSQKGSMVALTVALLFSVLMLLTANNKTKKQRMR